MAIHLAPLLVGIRYCNNTTSGGENLIPLTAAEALRYAERYADAETIEKFFKVEEA